MQHVAPRSPEQGIRDEQATEQADAGADTVVASVPRPAAVAVRPGPAVWVGAHDMHHWPLLHHDTRLVLQAGVASAGLGGLWRASYQEDLPLGSALRYGNPHHTRGCMHLQLLARAHTLWRNHLA